LKAQVQARFTALTRIARERAHLEERVRACGSTTPAG